MQDDRRFSGLYLDFDRPGGRPPSLWQKIVGGVAMVGVFALALTISVALFAVVLTVGVVVWGYLWWKTRAVRKAIREHLDARMAEGGTGPGEAPGPAGGQGLIIEGEVIREVQVEDDAATKRGRNQCV